MGTFFIPISYFLYPNYTFKTASNATRDNIENSAADYLHPINEAFKIREKLLIEMKDKNQYHISVGNNSNANFVISSPHAQVSLDASKRNKVVEQAEKIIEVVKEDNSLSEPVKDQALKVLAEFIEEANAGKTTAATYGKLLEIGANISSIGSLVIPVLQMISTGT